IDRQATAHYRHHRLGLVAEARHEDAAHGYPADQVTDDGSNRGCQTEDHGGDRFARYDLAAPDGGDEQRFERAALLLTGGRVDGRHLPTGERPDGDEERYEPRQLAAG